MNQLPQITSEDYTTELNVRAGVNALVSLLARPRLNVAILSIGTTLLLRVVEGEVHYVRIQVMSEQGFYNHQPVAKFQEALENGNPGQFAIHRIDFVLRDSSSKEPITWKEATDKMQWDGTI